jgi:hypothetical protein
MTHEKDKIINLEKTKNIKETLDLGGVLPQVFSQFAQGLKPKLIACFELLDDTLFDMSEKAETNQTQTMYFETMRTVRKQRSKMFTDFFDSIKYTFKQFKNNNLNYFDQDLGYNPDVKSLSLSLVDEKELDEALAKTNLINKSDMAYHQHIYAFEKRFSVLASGIELKSSQVPVSPHVVVNSFAKSLKNIDIDVTIKLIMYKLFERIIMGQLNDIYSNINKILVAKGVVPEIPYNIGQQTRASSGSMNDTAPNAHTSNDNENLSNQAQDIKKDDANTNHSHSNTNNNQVNIDPNYQLISQLFSHSHQSPPTNTDSESQNKSSNLANTSSVPNIDVGLMMNALTTLQSNVFNNTETSNKSPTEIKNELIKQLHKLDTDSIDKKVDQKDEDTIDLVGMLFQFIVDDRNLPDAIQVLLAKFQIPYLKVALKDKNLFADRTHPARKLLDKLSIASIGWTEQHDRNNAYISQIERITKEVLEVDDYSNQFFVDQLEQFEQFIAKQKKKSDVAQKRSKEKTLGQDKIFRAKEQSAQILIDKMSNKTMPSLIRELLLGEWANVLILMHLRHGSKSDEYKEKVKFIDLIVDYSQVKSDSKITIDMIKDVTGKYEKGLNLVAFNQKETIDKQHKLVECLNQIHDINPAKADLKDLKMISPEKILELSGVHTQHDIVGFIEDIIQPSDSTNQEEIEENFLMLVKALKIGSWLEFVKEEKLEVRAKLSWISPITSKYLFVNSRGLKITDKSNTELAAGLKDKTIRILKQVALFDRALSNIADKLKKTESKDKDIREEELKIEETKKTKS